MIRSPPSSVSRPKRASVSRQALTTRSFAPPAADDAFDTVLRHEIQGPLAGADDGLPAFDGEMAGSGDQGQLFQFVAPIGDFGWQVVVPAVMRK
jgi:hypothetical protein